jgi:osmotically inducible lipoprotein OsmB
MKKLIIGSLLLLGAGCQNMNNTEAGALGGGVIGGAFGTVIGAICHNPLAGAAIGGATGATVGALAGHSEDRREARAAAAAQAYAAAHPPLSLSDVASMAQNHISDGVIINQIRTTNSTYNLTAEQITWLKSQGVSDQVVYEMQIRQGVYVQPAPVYVVEPGQPSVGVGFGVGIRR